MTNECQAWIEAQENQFMRPECVEFTNDEAREYCFPEYPDDEEGKSHDLAGWYARLSAPGYMDCTDWTGPFDSEDEALESLYELFGDDCY